MADTADFDAALSTPVWKRFDLRDGSSDGGDGSDGRDERHTAGSTRAATEGQAGEE